MCGVCGCADPANEVSMTDSQTGVKVLLRDDHAHDHGHDHDHAHAEYPHAKHPLGPESARKPK